MSAAASAPSALRLAADQPIAQADQVVADVDRRRRAVLAVQRLVAVAELVVVLDVVVDQRRLVKRLDRQRRPLDRVGNRRCLLGAVGQRAFAAGAARRRRPA